MRSEKTVISSNYKITFGYTNDFHFVEYREGPAVAAASLLETILESVIVLTDSGQAAEMRDWTYPASRCLW